MIQRLTVIKGLAGLLIMMCLTTGCVTQTKEAPTMLLATTTSTEQTGLLEAILPDFTEQTGIQVKVIAVGTGQALELGQKGEADAVLVHARASEDKFVEDGFGIERFDVMVNDFVLVGSNPLSEGAQSNILEALQQIAEDQKRFVSRGDDSGTHKKELALWKKVGIEPAGEWYLSAGKGMGEVLQMADEKQAYTLADRATYLSMKKSLELQIVVEKDPSLLNPYGVIAVNPDKNPGVHAKEADQFIQWLLSKETQEKIGAFGLEQYGEPLFIPNAKE